MTNNAAMPYNKYCGCCGATRRMFPAALRAECSLRHYAPNAIGGATRRMLLAALRAECQRRGNAPSGRVPVNKRKNACKPTTDNTPSEPLRGAGVQLRGILLTPAPAGLRPAPHCTGHIASLPTARAPPPAGSPLLPLPRPLRVRHRSTEPAARGLRAAVLRAFGKEPLSQGRDAQPRRGGGEHAATLTTRAAERE